MLNFIQLLFLFLLQCVSHTAPAIIAVIVSWVEDRKPNLTPLIMIANLASNLRRLVVK